jgi:hypothetical protein
VKELKVSRNVFYHFQETHYAQLVVAVYQLDSLLGQARPSDTREWKLGTKSSQSRRYACRM